MPLYFVFLSFSLGFPLKAQVPNLIQFHYSSLDGSVYLNCQYEKTTTEGTYQVFCGKGTNLRKDFTVELKVRPIRFEPHSFYEVSVTSVKKGDPESKKEGTTIWIRLGDGAIQSLAVHQRVEDSKALLAIHYSLGL